MGRLLGRLWGVILCCVVALPLIPENGWAMGGSGTTDAGSDFTCTSSASLSPPNPTLLPIPEERDSGVNSSGGSSPGGSNGSTAPLLNNNPSPRTKPRMGLRALPDKRETAVTIEAEIKWPDWLRKTFSLSDCEAITQEVCGSTGKLSVQQKKRTSGSLSRLHC